jgi:hypothetical protein
MLALVDEPENALRTSFRPCRDEGMLAAALCLMRYGIFQNMV